MLWKDVRRLRSELDMAILDEINPKSQNKPPHMRPMESNFAAEIRLIEAQGVPIPKNQSGFQDDFIVKRAVNVGI